MTTYSSPLLLNGNLNCLGSLRQRQCRLRYRIYRSALAPIEVSCFVGQATALRANKRPGRSVSIVDAKLFAIAVPEIKFGQVALKVRFANVLIYAVDAPLKDREEAFNAV
jgi:hypothetical protein